MGIVTLKKLFLGFQEPDSLVASSFKGGCSGGEAFWQKPLWIVLSLVCPNCGVGNFYEFRLLVYCIFLDFAYFKVLLLVSHTDIYACDSPSGRKRRSRRVRKVCLLHWIVGQSCHVTVT